MELSKKDFFLKLFYIFLIGSFIGWFFEISLHLIRNNELLLSRSGLLYGPLMPVYGAGAVSLYLVTFKLKKWYQVFLLGMVTGGAVEYLFSYFQEILFNTISWDYQDYFLNIDGRTSLYHMAIWGILSIFFMKICTPLIDKYLSDFSNKISNVVSFILVILLSVNVIISFTACIRYDSRQKGKEANNIISSFLDKYYPNEKIDKVFNNRWKP